MIVKNFNEAEEKKIETYPYKGKQLPVKEVYIRWLSSVGPAGAADYGLRYFRIGPGGEIPPHNHLYYQTSYILTGRVRCFQHDADTDKVVIERVLGPGDFFFVPSMEVHSMKNESDREPVTFLCCIANVCEKEN